MDLCALCIFLVSHSEVFCAMSNREKRKELVEVADRICMIDKLEMYDKGWFKKVVESGDEYTTMQEFLFHATELNEMPALKKTIPFFFDDESEEIAAAQNSSSTNGMGGANEAKVVCSACGNRLEFKKQNAEKYNYMGFMCKYEDSELVFHDYLCVKLRKIKEAIREFVFLQEMEENKDIELENALINIEESQETDTSEELGFHDHLCVKLREIKEAIKGYVFLQEEEKENKDIELEIESLRIYESYESSSSSGYTDVSDESNESIPDESNRMEWTTLHENALINIEETGTSKENPKMRPKRKVCWREGASCSMVTWCSL